MGETISIVIPTSNRLSSLSLCLSCIDRQTAASLDRVVVVYHDLTHIPDKRLFRTIADKIVYLRSGDVSSGQKRTMGANIVSSPLIGFLDDDSFINDSWINEAVAGFSVSPRVEAQLGKLEWYRRDNVTAWKSILPELRQKTYNYRNDIFLDPLYKEKLAQGLHWDVPLGDMGLADHISTGNCAFRTRCFLDMGGFDPEFKVYYDKEFAFRLLSSGKPILYNPKMIVRHDHDPSFLVTLRKSLFTPKYVEMFKQKHKDKPWERFLEEHAAYFAEKEKNFQATLTVRERLINAAIRTSNKIGKALSL